jgi:hypothetical protein
MTAERKEISKPISNSQDNVARPADRGNVANKYSVEQYMYPIDLMSEQYGGNYAVFYVNMTNDSKLRPNTTNLALDPALEKRDRPDIIAKPVSTSSLTGSTAVLNTVAGLVGGSILGKGVGGAAKGVAIANLPTVGVAVAGANSPETTRSKRRTVATLALHVPNQLSVRYSMQWSDEDTAALQMTETGVEEILNALKSKSKSSTEGIVDVAKTTGSEIAQNVILSKGAGAVSGGALSAKLRIAANPKKEQAFKGVDFRTFTFDYQFFPRSEKEAEMVLNIVKTFKFHMHPEFKSQNHFVFIYPSEFDILYFTNGKENESIHRHTSCVLTDMNINYTPNGAFTTFDNGMPTQINMQLTFKELLILTKEQIDKGL